jgi:hypothetical protein
MLSCAIYNPGGKQGKFSVKVPVWGIKNSCPDNETRYNRPILSVA